MVGLWVLMGGAVEAFLLLLQVGDGMLLGMWMVGRAGFKENVIPKKLTLGICVLWFRNFCRRDATESWHW